MITRITCFICSAGDERTGASDIARYLDLVSFKKDWSIAGTHLDARSGRDLSPPESQNGLEGVEKMLESYKSGLPHSRGYSVAFNGPVRAMYVKPAPRDRVALISPIAPILRLHVHVRTRRLPIAV